MIEYVMCGAVALLVSPYQVELWFRVGPLKLNKNYRNCIKQKQKQLPTQGVFTIINSNRKKIIPSHLALSSAATLFRS